jgi:hypothetical protein
MALQKIIQHQTGAYSEYWRIINVDLNYFNNTAKITLYGYYNEYCRRDNKINLDLREFIANDEFDIYFSTENLSQNTNPVQQAYLYIKTNEEFFNSIDI